MGETPELLPCSFCGGDPWYGERMDEDIATHNLVMWKSVSCPNGCAQIDIPDDYEGGTAVERWNRREDAAAPQPEDDEREAMVRLLQIITRNGSLDDGRTLHEVIADALLAAGWTRKREADALIEAERRGAERMRERAAVKSRELWADYEAEESPDYIANGIRALPLTEENSDAE